MSNKYIKLFLGWPLSILAIFFISRIVLERKEIIQPLLLHVNILLLVYAIVCFMIYFGVRAFLWQKLLRFNNVLLPFQESSFYWTLAELRRYVPGTIWSVVSKTIFFSKYNISKTTVFKLLFFEAQFIILGSFSLSLLSIHFLIYEILSPLYIQKEYIIILLLVSAAGICIFLFHSYLSKKYQKFLFLEKLLPGLTAIKQFELLILSILSLAFFGLGTYLSIASILFLTPVYFLELIGYFNLALLLGYILIIIPSGIGVREAVITLGLSKLLLISYAGFAAIYTRVIFVFSELLFFVFILFWKLIRNSVLTKIEPIIKKKKYELTLFFFILVYCIYFSTVSIMRYDNFYTGRFDLGNMDQTVWNTLRGRIFQLTDPNGTEIISRLAFHADFILILLAPLYRIWSDPRMLLLLQTIILSLGAYFVYKISNFILKNETGSLMFGIVYLLNPGLSYSNLFDFHPVTLATTFLLASFYFMITRQYALFFIFSILAGITKEQVWLIVALMGISIIFLNAKIYTKKYSKKQMLSQLFGLGVFLTAIYIFYYLVWYAIPHARGSYHFALTYYSDFGTSPTGIIKNVFFSPLKTLNIIFHNGRLNYLVQLLLPLGFLPLAWPFTLLLALPDLLLNLLSNNTQLQQIHFQYTATITPFLFISAIYGVKLINKLISYLSIKTICICVLTTAIFTSYIYGPLPGTRSPNIDMITKQLEYKNDINKILSRLPKRYSIAATNNLGSHLSHRQRIFTIPLGLEKADIIAFLLNDPFAQPSLFSQKKMVVDLKNSSKYRILYEKEEFIIFKKIKI